jgi:hypothetical protein
VGWYGAAAILGAYILLSFHVLAPDSFWYQGLNATGAIAIVIDAWKDHNYQPVVLNLVWAGIAIAALVRVWF